MVHIRSFFAPFIFDFDPSPELGFKTGSDILRPRFLLKALRFYGNSVMFIINISSLLSTIIPNGERIVSFQDSFRLILNSFSFSFIEFSSDPQTWANGFNRRYEIHIAL